VAGSKASDRALALCEAWRLARCKNISASYLCASASSAFPALSAFICDPLYLRASAASIRCRLDHGRQQASDCAPVLYEPCRRCKIQKRYRRLICVHRRHLRPRVICVYLRSTSSACICCFDPLQVWIVTGSKPVTAPRRRAKPGTFCKIQNAIGVSSVFIGVICVPALSAYICGPFYLCASAASIRCRFGSWRAASR
jgi:hypothetical protein